MSVSSTELVRCPYDPVHMMRRHRLQAHIMKCRVNHPEIKLKTCLLNSLHLVPEEDFFKHMNSCPDRVIIEEYKFDVRPQEEERIKHEEIESEENWDDTCVQDYNPQTAAANANILRIPQGYNKSQRKKFLREERERLGDVVDVPSDDDGTEKNHFRLDGLPPTPPPPKWDSSDGEEEDDDDETTNKKNDDTSDQEDWKSARSSLSVSSYRTAKPMDKFSNDRHDAGRFDRQRSRSPPCSSTNRFGGGDRYGNANDRFHRLYGNDAIRGRSRNWRGPDRGAAQDHERRRRDTEGERDYDRQAKKRTYNNQFD